MSWAIRKFGDVVQFPPQVKLKKGKLYSFIPLDEITAGKKYVGQQFLKEWKGSGGAKFIEGDTLFARINPSLQNGKISQAKGLDTGMGFGSTEYFVFRGIEGITDTDFIYYLSISHEFKENAIGSMVGASGRQRADAKFVGQYEINLPPLQTQKRIADILSAYDDLIENNLKRIKLLEQAAQNIYKEWFVNLRFPGYENTFINEETGLPKGWAYGVVSDLCQVKSGYAFKSKQWKKEGNPVIKIKNINNNTVSLNDSGFVDDEVADVAKKYELFTGDVVIAMTGATVGKVGLIPKIDNRIYLNQRVGLFRPLSEENNNIALVFSFFLTDDSQQQVLNFAQGAAQPNISGSEIGNIKLSIADSKVLSEFNKLIKPSLDLIQTLYGQNQKLKAARDILLPRLMNRTIIT
ncbi:MAG: restriction endonuclease subunit S [Galbibacter orientalis]|uniref:restriction endonuclease subunit S n=1 Tax=Galbibacter orientalis TaxID=453852 RepID=UPI0030036BF6